jgi:O-acetyl-ADP-ribose deacetylase (regulator of RNase III)
VDIRVVQGSLTDGGELVLVNASNTGVSLGSGVSAAIRAACGPGYQEHIHEELRRHKGGPMEPGDVLLTDAGDHPTAAFVAHVAVMDYRSGARETSPTEQRIQSACERLWRLVDELDTKSPRSVAMVALGAGVGGLGVVTPTRIACQSLKVHTDAGGSKIAGVTFYGWSDAEYRAIADEVCAVFPQAVVG